MVQESEDQAHDNHLKVGAVFGPNMLFFQGSNMWKY